jgi:hypothetical protein
MAKQRIPELNQLQISPHLSPPDIFLFPKIKYTLKGRRFEDTENIKRKNKGTVDII